LAAVVALAACSKEETLIADRGDAIGFGTPFVENSTRASYSDNDVLVNQFNVYGTVNGIALFGGDGAVVSRGNKAYGVAWDCSEAEYWIPGAKYVFEAVVDGTISNGTIAYTIGANPDSDGVNDLLYAKEIVESATADQGLVEFNFTHLLSKVGFTFTNGATANAAYTFNVTGVSFTGHDTTGTYTISSGEWDEDVTASGTALSFGAPGAVASTAVAAPTTHQIIPGEQTLNVTVTYDILYNGTTMSTGVTATKELAHTFEKSNVYNIAVVLPAPGQPIQFSVDENNGVGAWTDGGSTNLEY
jgi:hypothetical protein